MTRELKLALIVGFALVLVVTVLISDHLSHARQAELAGNIPAEPLKATEPPAIAMGNESAPADETPSPSHTFAANTPVPPVEPAPSAPVTQDPGPLVLTQGGHASPTPETGRVSEHADLIREVNKQGGSVHGDTIVLGPPAVKTVQEALPTPQPRTPAQVTPLPPVPAVTPGPADAVYTVLAGDSIYKIAKQNYGDGKAWRKLARYNKLDENAQIKVGTKLNIPSSEVLLGKKAVIATAVLPAKASTTPIVVPKPTRTPTTGGIRLTGTSGAAPTTLTPPTAPASTAKGHTYTVKKGDTLAQIAQHELGNSKRANEIVQLNKKTIKDPDNVPLGAVLTLPA